MKATPPLRPSRRDLPAATPGRLFGGLIVLAGLTLLLPVRWSVAQDAREVSRPVIFAQPLEWCGDQRLAAAQAPALQEILDLQGAWGIEGLVEGLEQFLEALPDSPWAPSLQINLGRFYFEQGRYTPALLHWQAAWEATRQTPTDPERRIADYAFAHWTRVLAGLGRVEMVQLLYAENADREFTPGPIETMVARTGEALALVLSQPDTLHQCGLLALGEVARGVGADPAVVQALREIRAPAWSLRHLLDAAEPFELELLAVELPEGTDWVVPSVVHLRQNHYVAIIARDGEVYEVADPSFGRNQFLSGAALWSEASGVCLVPARLLEGPWRLLADAELDGVVGRGYVTSFDDPVDQGCPAESCDCPQGQPSPQPGLPVSEGDPTAPCTDCGPPGGMPTWRVSEPFINLWLHDRPLFYQPALGDLMALDLAYKQRDEDAGLDAGVFGFGMGWNSGWLSYVQPSITYRQYGSGEIAVRLPGGGKAFFNFAYGANSATAYESNSRLDITRDQSGVITAFTLTYPGGVRYVYEFFRTDNLGAWDQVYLTQRISRHGYAITLAYATYNPGTRVVRLASVTDPDGRSITLQYAAGIPAHPNLVSSATSSHYSLTASLAYNAAGQLTSITDVVGIQSTLTYAASCPATFTTPYGTTSFAPAEVQYMADDSVIARSMVVTEPNQGRQIFAMLYQCLWMPYNPPAAVIPAGPSGNTFDSAYTHLLFNSFHWDQQQAQGLPAAVVNFATSAFVKARMFHWLERQSSPAHPSSTAAYRRDPSPDGTAEGQYTWFDHTGKSQPWFAGTQILPKTVARVMPDGQTAFEQFQRNAFGLPTQIIERWGPNASPLYRTNSFVYAANAIDLIEHRGPDGLRKTGYGYNAYHQPTSITNAPGEVTTLTYDAQRRLQTVQTPAGLLSTHTYGTDGRLQRTVDSAVGGGPLRTNAFTWLGGYLRTRTDERDLALTYTYDKLGRLTRIDYPDSTYEFHGYTNGAGIKLLDRTYSRDRLGQITRTEYTALRQVHKVFNPRGHATTYTYCGCGGPTTVANALGQVTTYTYNNAGRHTDTLYPDNTVVSYGYDLAGRLRTVSDSLGTVTNFYDNLNRLTTVSNAFGRVLGLGYDLEDNVTARTNANGVILLSTYDQLHRPLSQTWPDTGIERFLYTPRGLVAHTNQLGKVTRIEYNPLGRKTAETNANLEVIRYTYNPAGDLLTLRDGKNQVTTWAYDRYGQVTNKLDQASAQILRYQYDAGGRLTNRWSAAKGNTAYGYDQAGNLTNVIYAVSPQLRYQYDAANRVTNMIDGVGTTTYTYTAAGNLLTEDSPWASDTVTYAYHASVPGLRTGLTLQQPSGSSSQTYGYDAAKRLSTVGGTAGTHTYTYRGAGTLWTNLALPNTSRITNAYSSIGALTNTTLRTSGGTVTNRHSYVYNLAHQRTRQTRSDASTVDYTYDHIGQLRTAVGTGGQSTENLQYGYDTAWNLSKRTNAGVIHTFTVDVKNQLVSTPYGTCAYDANGNLTSDGGSRTFTYDDENQLTQVIWGSGSYRTDFAYDGRGRMRLRTEYYWSGGSWSQTSQARYLYDGMLLIQERTSANTPTVSYARGQDLSGTLEGAGGIGGLLARSDQYSGGTWGRHVFYHADGNGNVTALIDSAQTVVAAYRYNPYGQLLGSSGSLAGVNTLRFSSKPWFQSEGLYYYGYRFYDPNLQRWINRDPFGEEGGINLYGFVGNDPSNYLDPFGLDVWLIRRWTGLWPHYYVVGDNYDGTYWYADFFPMNRGGLRFPFILWGIPLNAPGDARFFETSDRNPHSLGEGEKIARHVKCCKDATRKAKEQAKETADPINPQPRYDVAGHNCWNYATRIADRAAAGTVGDLFRNRRR